MMPGLTLNQTPSLSLQQKQVIGVRQMHSMKILQLPALKLHEYLTEVMQQNPAMEMTDNREELSGDMFEDSFQDAAGDSDSEEYRQYKMDSITGGQSIYSTLCAQLGELLGHEEDDPMYRGCCEVAGNIDDNGYLQATDEELAKGARITLEQARAAVQFVQQNIEPAGIGGHDLRECLQIQLERKGEKESIAWQIVTEFWEELQKNRLNDIADELDVEMEEVEDALRLIAELNPKPASSMDTQQPTLSVFPEVRVIRLPGGKLGVLPLDSSIPTVSVSVDYVENMLKKGNKRRTAEEQQAIKKYVDEVNQLIHDLDFRKSMVVKLAETLVRLQPGFFNKGKKEVRPLSMTDLAKELEVSVSTVSRAVGDKYMRLPNGHNAAFKELLSAKAGQNQCTSDDIKKMLKDAIESENRAKPYSDQALSELLGRQGITISRRAVNKYRDEMGVGAASERKARK